MTALALVMAVVGAGLLRSARPGARNRFISRKDRLGDLLVEAGFARTHRRRVLGIAAAASVVAGGVVTALSRTPVVAAAFAALACWWPFAWLRARARRRRLDRRELWPDVVDHLLSAVRAGLPLPDAVVALHARGPEPLRADFGGFAAHYARSGDFPAALDALRDRLADPAADRIVAVLRLTRDVGGTDVGLVLRSLSSFLRDDARVRAELEARQSWTVNAARLALAAPWAVLGLLALRPETVRAYDSAAGVAVLVVGGAVSVLAYRLMLRLARLPQDERVRA